jgi:uncharacterized Tic20 family protein
VVAEFEYSSGPAPEPPPTLTKDERLWGMLCHLAALSAMLGVPFGNIIGPLVVWLIKRQEMPWVDAHGKESLNFQISLTIYSIGAFILAFVLIGFFILIAIMIFGLVMVIIASIKANDGEMYRYPLTIRIIK